MRKSIRAVGIVIKKDKVLLMWRKNEGKEYYTFPGGGVEEKESVEDAVVRELKEETSTENKIIKLLYHHHLINDGDQYFYLCQYLSGKTEIGKNSEEAREMKSGQNLFKPLWASIKELDKLLLYPLEVRDWLIEDYKDDFKRTPRKASLEIKDLRQEI